MALMPSIITLKISLLQMMGLSHKIHPYFIHILLPFLCMRACIQAFDMMIVIFSLNISNVFHCLFYSFFSLFHNRIFVCERAILPFHHCVVVLVLCTYDFCCMNEIRHFVSLSALNVWMPKIGFIFADPIHPSNRIKEMKWNTILETLLNYFFPHRFIDDVFCRHLQNNQNVGICF